MDQGQIEEFCTVRDRAYNGLRAGKYIARDRSVPLCQFLILPSFDNPVCWDVIGVVARDIGAQVRLYRSCWRMDVDGEALSSQVERLKHPTPYVPTVDVAWVLIDQSRVESTLRRLRSESIPLVLQDYMDGCDGESYEFSVGDFFCNTRISWWCDLPKEWERLGPIIADLQQLFEQTWASAPQTPCEPAK